MDRPALGELRAEVLGAEPEPLSRLMPMETPGPIAGHRDGAEYHPTLP